MGIDEVDDVGELIILLMLSKSSSASVFVKSDLYLAPSATSLAFVSDPI